MKVGTEDVVDVAVNELGWTASPTTDLVMAVRQKFRITDTKAGKLVGKVLDKGLIRQVSKEEWENLNRSSMTAGFLSVPTTKFRWVKN